MSVVAVEAAANPARRTAKVLGLSAIGPAVIGLVIGWFSGHALGAIIGFIVLGAAAPAVVWVRAGRDQSAGLGGVPADSKRHARLFNLTDGLCITAGVKVPELRVVESDGLNLAIAGRDVDRGVLVATSGLLDALSRMELEGIVAVAVAALRRGDTTPATLAAAAFGVGAQLAVDPHRDRIVDEGAVLLTRYPPGLVSAYEKLRAASTTVAAVPRRSVSLWLADPVLGAGAAPSYRTSLTDRIDALNEL